MKNESGKGTTGENAAPVGACDKANPSGGRGAGLEEYNREQVRRFINNLRADCSYICDTVKESLYNDGAGLLEDESIRAPLGRIAYIDSFFRYFGGGLKVDDILEFLNDLLPPNLTTAGGAVDLKLLLRVPAIDRGLVKDILDTGDDETSLYNLTVYFFSLWVNFHVGAVVSVFQKWLEVCGDNVPRVLRDVSELAGCGCYYTRTEDNATGGFLYDGGWFESFAICGDRLGERNAAQGAANKKPDAERVANPSGGGAGFSIHAETVVLNAGKVSGATVPEQKPAGHCGGISQSDFAALLKHYGGKKNGEPYTVKTVKNWERNPNTRPTAGGVVYTPELRRDILKARTWALNFNEENRNAYNARRARV